MSYYMIKRVLWLILALWSLYMVSQNNKYLKFRSGAEKGMLAWDLLVWLVVAILSLVKAAAIL